MFHVIQCASLGSKPLWLPNKLSGPSRESARVGFQGVLVGFAPSDAVLRGAFFCLRCLVLACVEMVANLAWSLARCSGITRDGRSCVARLLRAIRLMMCAASPGWSVIILVASASMTVIAAISGPATAMMESVSASGGGVVGVGAGCSVFVLARR